MLYFYLLGLIVSVILFITACIKVRNRVEVIDVLAAIAFSLFSWISVSVIVVHYLVENPIVLWEKK